ncbi:MAG: hypothetical protein IPJ00_05935 [Saprospirales bacterium]|jgi:hypothetical protein|nr:hypothetical protein [Saprospirales bacterium]MBK7335717.1 hypothetical protein [Saprospirales bacterium]
MENRKEFKIQGNTWGMIALLVVGLIAVFIIARGIFWLLSLVAPILLIAAAIIDHRVIVNYAKWLVDLIKRNILVGLGAILLSIVGYPVVFALLLGRALMNKKLKDMEQQERTRRDGELVDYEELETKIPPIELPRDEKEG